MRNKNFVAEVWVMWRRAHGITTHRLLNISDWIAAFGLIPSILIAIFNSGVIRHITIIFAGLFLLILIISFFRAASQVWQRDTTKLIFIQRQKNEVRRYLHSRFRNLSLKNNRQIELEIELFNGTIFEIEFQSATGVIKINDLECKLSSIEKRLCSPGEPCNYGITLPSDSDVLQVVRDALSDKTQVNLYAVLDIEVKVIYEYDGKPESTKQSKVQALIDNILIIPQKV